MAGRSCPDDIEPQIRRVSRRAGRSCVDAPGGFVHHRTAYLCFIALVCVLLNLIFDVLYYAVDVRLLVERGAAY